MIGALYKLDMKSPNELYPWLRTECISSEKLYANNKNSFLSSLFLFTWTFFPGGLRR